MSTPQDSTPIVPNPVPSTVVPSDKDKVLIFDTTMRDGEQAPGASMSFEEKMELAKILEDMKVDVIEAGFPITSNGDFQAVHEISKVVKGSIIAAYSSG